MNKILNTVIISALILAIATGYTPIAPTRKNCVAMLTHTLSPELKSKSRVEAEAIILAVTKHLLEPKQTQTSTWPEITQSFDYALTDITHGLLCVAFTKIDPSMFMSMFIATNFRQLSQVVYNLHNKAALHNLNIVVFIALMPFAVAILLTYNALHFFLLFAGKLKNKILSATVLNKERRHRKDALVNSKNKAAAPVRIQEEEITAIINDIEYDLTQNGSVITKLIRKNSPFKDKLRQIQPAVKSYLEQALRADPISHYDKRHIRLFALCILIDCWNNDPEMFGNDLWRFRKAFKYLLKNIRLVPKYDNANAKGKYGIPFLQRMQTNAKNNIELMNLISHEVAHLVASYTINQSLEDEDKETFAFKTLNEIFAILHQKKFFVRYRINPLRLLPDHQLLLSQAKANSNLIEEHRAALFIIDQLQKAGYSADTMASVFRDIYYKSHYLINSMLSQSPYFMNTQEFCLLTSA